MMVTWYRVQGGDGSSTSNNGGVVQERVEYTGSL